MNDSCEKRVNRKRDRANQVFSLETPKTMLHAALAAIGLGEEGNERLRLYDSMSKKAFDGSWRRGSFTL
jgi:hypothetical protein